MILPFLSLGVECEWGAGASSPNHARGLGQLDGRSSTSVDDTPLSEAEASWLSSVVFAGMLVGALLSGLLADRWGRRPTVLFLTALVAVMGLCSAVASSFATLLLARGLVGVGVGGSPAALSLFTEFLPRDHRGSHLVHYMLFFSTGSVMQVLVAWWTLNEYGWRCLLFLSALPAVALTVLAAIYIPESPGWLLSRGRVKEAREVLSMVYRTNHPYQQHEDPCPLAMGGRAHQSRSRGSRIQHSTEEDMSPESILPCTCEEHEEGVQDIQVTGSIQNSTAPISSHSVAATSSSPTSMPYSAVEPLPPTAHHATLPPSSSSSSSSSTSFIQPIFLVFSRSLRTISIMLCLLFFLMAFVYYGLVLMSLSLVQDQEQHAQKECTLRTDQYVQLLIANAAEFPGLFLLFFLLDRIGRRLTITWMFLSTGACMLLMPLMWLLQSCDGFENGNGKVGGAGIVSKGHMSGSQQAHCTWTEFLAWIQSILIFGARAFSLAFNQGLWIYTTELFPAQVRSSGLGVTTVFARIGGAASAWVCQWLYWHDRYLAVLSCVGAAVVAAGVASKMPKDTKDRHLDIHVRGVKQDLFETEANEREDWKGKRQHAAVQEENDADVVDGAVKHSDTSHYSQVQSSRPSSSHPPRSNGGNSTDASDHDIRPLNHDRSSGSRSSSSSSTSSTSSEEGQRLALARERAAEIEADREALATLNLDILKADQSAEQ